MRYDQKILDRQVGRNAQLFAQAISDLDTAEKRFPYLRILISLVEQAHPEWNQTSKKELQITELVVEMSEGTLKKEEVLEVVKVREKEKRIN